MTNRDFYTQVIEATINEEITAHAQKAIDKLDATNTHRRSTPTTKQLENENLKANILESMTSTIVTAAEIGTNFGISTSKASSMLRQLVESGTIVSSEVKIKGKGKVKGYCKAE